jgi:hypothetical protein
MIDAAAADAGLRMRAGSNPHVGGCGTSQLPPSLSEFTHGVPLPDDARRGASVINEAPASPRWGDVIGTGQREHPRSRSPGYDVDGDVPAIQSLRRANIWPSARDAISKPTRRSNGRDVGAGVRRSILIQRNVDEQP